jgi:hypothetical protein
MAFHFNDSKSRMFILGYANQGLNINLWHKDVSTSFQRFKSEITSEIRKTNDPNSHL